MDGTTKAQLAVHLQTLKDLTLCTQILKLSQLKSWELMSITGGLIDNSFYLA
jgi:hypothetical protein